ncbi:MAG: hypothetical protein GEU78_00015 [Actinobacteria bacterium]|nr:hypothetical protein [Actinomycetota bacterium]
MALGSRHPRQFFPRTLFGPKMATNTSNAIGIKTQNQASQLSMAQIINRSSTAIWVARATRMLSSGTNVTLMVGSRFVGSWLASKSARRRVLPSA